MLCGTCVKNYLETTCDKFNLVKIYVIKTAASEWTDIFYNCKFVASTSLTV